MQYVRRPWVEGRKEISPIKYSGKEDAFIATPRSLIKVVLALAVLGSCMGGVWVGSSRYFSREAAATCGQAVEHLIGQEPLEYRIVYLIENAGLEANPFMKPAYLENQLQVQTVYCWADVRSLSRVAQVDAIIIHRSALPQVEERWLREVYRRGVVVVGFNIYASEMGALLDDPRVAEHGLEPPFSRPFFLSAHRFSTAGPDRRESSGRTNEQLSTEAYFTLFKKTLLHQIDGIAEMRE